MAIINVPAGGQARSIHVQQIINWLRGIPSFSEAVSFTGITSDSAYALTTANGGTGGRSLAAKNSNQSITLLEVLNAGVIVRPNAASDIVAFRVRNFLDSADLFSVEVDGTVNLSILNAPTVNNGIFTSPNVSNYLELDWNSSPGGAVNKSRLWAKNDNSLYYTLPGGTVVTLITSLNTPILTSLGFARGLALSGG